MSSRIAFVDQPIGRVALPSGDRPFSSGSIGLWNYHVARQCAHEHECFVFAHGAGNGDTSRVLEDVSYQIVPDQGDERQAMKDRRWLRLLNFLHIEPEPTRPYFLSPRFYENYTKFVAREIRRLQCDIVNLTNFSQLVPEIRRENPNIHINIHMQCEWMNQLDHDILAQRLAQCDSISGCSQFIVDLIAARFPDQASKCFPMLNGVDESLFEPAQPAPDEPENLEILFAGRVSPEKGMHVLMEAFNRVVERFPHARLTLIGGRSSAPYEYIPALDPDPLVQKMAKFHARSRKDTYQNHLDHLLTPAARGQIHYIDTCPQAHLVAAFQRTSVFVFPSTWNEPFGMPLIEAMACAKPVVSTYSGGIPEFVKDGVNGLLVERGEVGPLADALITLLDSPELRERLGRTGRSMIEASLTWKHVADNFFHNVVQNDAAVMEERSAQA